MDYSTDECRYLPIFKSEAFIRSDVDDISDEALQKPKISFTTLSTEIVDSVSMNFFQEDSVSAAKFSNRPVCMCDEGANRSITNNISALHGVQTIPLHYIGGIGSGIQCVS